jgi:lactate dehydrogenase-like 2-hydroxyacid dehydrogenase
MPRPGLLVTRKLPDAVLARARRDYAARIDETDAVLSRAELVARADGCEAILCAPGDPLGAETIRALPGSVRAISTFSVGYDHLDVTAARARGIACFHTPGVLTDATAEIALLLLLGAARRAHEGQRMLREGGWRAWTPTLLLGRGLAGARLGIFGMGRIGRAVAVRARAFGMQIHYASRRRLAPELEAGAQFHADSDDLLRRSDCLSLHCPASPETHHWLDARRLALLPKGAIVINTARGSVVDDGALIAALASGHLAAAGLDVYENEPQVDPRYLALDSAFLLPHLGSATREAREAMGNLALDNLDAFFAGKPAPAPISFSPGPP